MSAVPILWLHDTTVGADKSDIGWELFQQTVRAGIKTAYVDLEYIGAFGPPPEDDPDNHRLKIRLLAALWPSYRADGVRCLVVFSASDVIDVEARLADALPGSVVTVGRTDDVGGLSAVHVAEKLRASAGDWPFPALEQ